MERGKAVRSNCSSGPMSDPKGGETSDRGEEEAGESM